MYPWLQSDSFVECIQSPERIKTQTEREMNENVLHLKLHITNTCDASAFCFPFKITVEVQTVKLLTIQGWQPSVSRN